MNITKTLSCLLLGLAGLALSSAALADQGTKYSEEGADTCLNCHDEDDGAYFVKGVFKSKHGQRGDKRAPFGAGGLQCEACHGPGGNHTTKGGGSKKATINSFKPDSFLSVAQRNQSCLGCHEGQARSAWHGAAHDRNQVACSDCHRIHAENGDPVLSKTTEADVCYTCHAKKRAEFLKMSAHPVRQGLMACSDCHNPHGSNSTAMLLKPTLNQTCYSCHAEKRGPLLWEHAPVTEDCSLCHNPHGTVRPAMLTKSPPLLCQQCHAAAGHPSVARTGAALPGGGSSAGVFLLVGSCTNCHSQVHGSNHPSGAKLMR